MGKIAGFACALALALCLAPARAQEPAGLGVVDRIQQANLAKLHEAVVALRAQAKQPAVDDGYDDFRAVIHAHSRLSHDSRGTPEEILAAAKETNTRVVMMTEHPNPAIDWFTEGLSGTRDGVIFVPGAETDGLLAFPTASLKGRSWASPQALVDILDAQGGLSFLSHVEERLDWDLSGLTGMEIYNTHTSLILHPELQAYIGSALADTKKMAELTTAFTQYHAEAFASLQFHLDKIVKRWDELTAKERLAGIAANDSHNNTGFVAKVGEAGRLVIEDPIGDKLMEVEAAKVPMLAAAAKGKNPGDVIFQLRLDPYPISFGLVGTHLLMKDFDKDSVWKALKAGHCFVGFDWMVDSTGFVFMADDGQRKAVMGDEIKLSPSMKLTAAAPVSGKMRLFENGQMILEKETDRLEFAPKEPGVYRVEVWLSPAGDLRPWIYSDPIYVR